MSLLEVQIDNDSLKSILDTAWLGLKTITDIKEENALGKGEHYGSVMKRLIITGTDSNGRTMRKNVIMKKDRVMPEEVDLSIFKCEIQAYTKILPKMKELIDAAKDSANMEVLWPFCLGVRNYDIILLEDLVEVGYAMRNRRVPLSSDIALFCAGELGKFHGLSIAAVRRKLIDPSILTPNKYASNNAVLNNLMSGGLLTLADCLEKDPQRASVVTKLRDLAKNGAMLLVNLAKDTKDIFPVISHGDCWTNNMLFKYKKDTETPVSVRFVDYQNVHYNCFAWDLTNILHSSMSAQARQPRYKEIIENYRNCLVKTLEALQEETSGVPDLERMLKIMDDFAPFALMVAFSLFPLTINNLENPWDSEKIITNEPVNAHPPELFDNEIVKKSVELEIQRFKSQGLL